MTNTHPLTDRRARPRTGSHTAPTHRACSANACPTPQACEVADETPATSAELLGFVLWAAFFAVAIVSVLISCANA